MKKQEKSDISINTRFQSKQGFTLVELLTVIAIIGILASVVLVSTQSGVDKSKTASAITTMSSLLPELVTCADDGGFGIDTVAPTTDVYVCCNAVSSSVGACDTVTTDNRSGHTVKWPNINTKTGYTYGVSTGTLSAGTYTFKATKGTSPNLSTITCSYAANECTEVKS